MKKIIAAVVLSTASFAALASDPGFYVTAGAGSASYSNANSQFTTGLAFKNPGALSIGGGYHFNPYLGLEAGYSLLGESTITTYGFFYTITEKLNASSLRLAAVGSIPINEKFELFGQLGLANTKVDYTASVVGGTFAAGVSPSASASKTNLMYGLGGQFNINKRFSIRAQYQDLGKVQLPGNFAGGVRAPNIGVKIVSVSGVFNF